MEPSQTQSDRSDQQVRQGWVARLVRVTWKSFTAKFIAGVSFVITITATLTFVLGSSIPHPVRLGGALVFGLLFVVLAIFYTAKGLITLAQQGEELAEDLNRAWAQVRSLNLEKEEWQKEETTPRHGVRLASGLYGVVFYLDKIDCILEGDGGLLLNSSVKMAATTSGLVSIENHVTAPHAPETWDEVIELVAEDQDDESVLLQPVTVEKTAKRLYWQLVAIPEFRKGHRIEYSFKEVLPAGAFAMTLKDMQARDLTWEYFYRRITRPTERLVLTVTMPPDFLPEEWDFDVWFGWRGQVRHKLEYYRIVRDEFWQVNRLNRHNQLVFQLDVLNPIQGLYYAIKWRPPDI